MISASETFQNFSTALKKELGVAILEQQVEDKIWQISFENKPLQLNFYTLGSTEGRIKNAPDEAQKASQIPKTIHLDEDLWVQQPRIVMGRLLALLGKARKIHARETVVARIDKKMALQFQTEHHLHVALPGKYRYGLFYQGELVSIAVLSGGRKMRGQTPEYRSFELLRTCQKSGLVVVGGLSKLIRHFEEQFQPDDLMTYIDKDWSDGESYLKLGFKQVGELPPQQFWVDCRTLLRYTDFELPEEIVSCAPKHRQELAFRQITNSGSLKLVKKNFIPTFG